MYSRVSYKPNKAAEASQAATNSPMKALAAEVSRKSSVTASSPVKTYAGSARTPSPLGQRPLSPSSKSRMIVPLVHLEEEATKIQDIKQPNMYRRLSIAGQARTLTVSTDIPHSPTSLSSPTSPSARFAMNSPKLRMLAIGILSPKGKDFPAPPNSPAGGPPEPVDSVSLVLNAAAAATGVSTKKKSATGKAVDVERLLRSVPASAGLLSLAEVVKAHVDPSNMPFSSRAPTSDTLVLHDAKQPVASLLSTLSVLTTASVHIDELCGPSSVREFAKVVVVASDLRLSFLSDDAVVDKIHQALDSDFNNIAVTMLMSPAGKADLSVVLKRGDAPAPPTSCKHAKVARWAMRSVSAMAVRELNYVSDEHSAEAGFVAHGIARLLETWGGSARVAASLLDRSLQGRNLPMSLMIERLTLAGRLLVKCGKYDDASRKFERAIDLLRSTGGGLMDHGDVLRQYGLLLLEIQEYSQAQRMLDEALAVHTERAQDHEIALDLHALAEFNIVAGDKKLAEQHALRALSLDIATFSAKSMVVADDYIEVGVILAVLGKLDRAVSMFATAARIAEDVSPASMASACAHNVWAFSLMEQGQKEKAKETGMKALAIFQRDLDGDDPLLVEAESLWGE